MHGLCHVQSAQVHKCGKFCDQKLTFLHSRAGIHTGRLGDEVVLVTLDALRRD